MFHPNAILAINTEAKIDHVEPLFICDLPYILMMQISSVRIVTVTACVRFIIYLLGVQLSKP